MFRSTSGAAYPVGWQVAIPGVGLSLEVTTPLAHQELVTPAAGIAYWEGLVDVTGTSRGATINGRGYLEMTGYKGSLGRVMTQ
jgi:predicted secreted hydrolase